MNKRGHKRLTAAQFRSLQQRWYKKAKRPYKDQDGNVQQFKDIEYGYDLNKFNAQTFRSSSTGGYSHGIVMLVDFERMEAEGDCHALESYGWDGTNGLGESDTYERFQRIGEHVHAMPDDSTAKRVCLAVLECNGDVSKAAKRLRMSRPVVKDTWESECSGLGLPVKTQAVKGEPRPEPGPVRQLSKSEIRRLKYTPPKEIK